MGIKKPQKGIPLALYPFLALTREWKLGVPPCRSLDLSHVEVFAHHHDETNMIPSLTNVNERYGEHLWQQRQHTSATDVP